MDSKWSTSTIITAEGGYGLIAYKSGWASQKKIDLGLKCEFLWLLLLAFQDLQILDCVCIILCQFKLKMHEPITI